jgi:uncharacterized protein (DUF58 family)
MKLSPDRSLIGLVIMWLALAVASVPLTVLRPWVPVAALVLIAAVLADAWLALREPALELVRTLPEKGVREQEAEVVLTLRSRAARALLVDVREGVPRDLIHPEPAWSGLRVEAASDLALRYLICPRVRGDRHFGEAIALVRSPLGLLRRRVMLGGSARQTLRVQPETARYLRREALDPKRVLASLGVRPKRKRGDGMEFEGLREYVLGDEPRRIDWRATARRGSPIVRTYRHEESRTVLICVDQSRLMGTRAANPAATKAEGDFVSTKLDHAIDAALALSFASLAAGDRVGLSTFDSGMQSYLPPAPHRGSLGRFVEILSEIAPRGVEADYRRVTREILTRQRKRAMIVVLTDFIEVDRDELIQPMSILARQHEVVFVALREPILEQLEELDPSTAGNLQDREAMRFRQVVLSDLLHEREGRLLALRRRGLSVLDVSPRDATAQAVNRYLELRYGAA